MPDRTACSPDRPPGSSGPTSDDHSLWRRAGCHADRQSAPRPDRRPRECPLARGRRTSRRRTSRRRTWRALAARPRAYERGGIPPSSQTRSAAGRAAPSAPYAGDPPTARRAAAVASDPLLANRIAVALDQELPAVGAPGMLPTVDSTREVTRVDELQARRRPDLARAKQRLGRGVVGIGHPVVLVERGDVPRNFGAHGGHVVGGATQLGVVVVEPRN